MRDANTLVLSTGERPSEDIVDLDQVAGQEQMKNSMDRTRCGYMVHGRHINLWETIVNDICIGYSRQHL